MSIFAPIDAATRLRFYLFGAFILALLSCCAYFLFSGWSYVGITISLILATIAFWIAYSQQRLLDTIARALGRLSVGDYSARIYADSVFGETALASNFNDAASAIEGDISSLRVQLQEHEAVLASMVEGVVAIDNTDRILRINEAAAEVMGVSVAGALSKPLSQIVRHVELLRFVEEVRTSSAPLEKDIRFSLGGEKTLRATGATLRDLNGQSIGALLVFSDVTHMRRLENMRREFVANVSHELRTPITAIKGFVETLEDGALNNPDDAKRFIDIIGRHAARLSAIFDDLLTLSRIEESNREESIQLSSGSIAVVIKNAIEACSARAKEKNIELSMIGSASLCTQINGGLLEQAVVNLIQNAITYSEAGAAVQVSAQCEEQEIRIKVIDSGVGIESIHLPRLFERFYRVDKSRVRSAGGTGLGLAIVKHVAESHHGSVSVTSTPGKGSTFVIHLPLVGNSTQGSSGAAA